MKFLFVCLVLGVFAETVAPETQDTTVAPDVPTADPAINTTTTLAPDTTTTLAPTPAPSTNITTTETTTTTTKQATTQPEPVTTLVPVITTTSAPVTTVAPEPAGTFSGSSFIGGMVLSAALIGIGYFGLKFYQARNPNYRTL